MKSSYNKYGLYFSVGSLVISSLWIAYLMIGRYQIDLNELEEEQQASSQESGVEAIKKPWIVSKELLSHGEKIYKVQCALCHGAKGLGDGSPGLVPPPRNLVEGKWKQGGSLKNLFITLQKGVAGSSMVPFQHLPQTDRWALVHYIHSITKNKVADDIKELEEFAKQAL